MLLEDLAEDHQEPPAPGSSMFARALRELEEKYY